MLKRTRKQQEIVLQRFLMDRHFREFEQHEPNIKMELPIDVIGKEDSIYFLFDGLISFDLYIHFIQNLFLS